MKSYLLVSILLLLNSILVYIYTKNIQILVSGITVAVIIYIVVKIIFERFVHQ
ncbi:hypothetical protein SUSAZ_02555 [Sulfolobus acidocaldarius SUSAZ]|nr:hypothetical protein SUSAZ_02555 [Sulfolobus acidocaldarius SUSAZ]